MNGNFAPDKPKQAEDRWQRVFLEAAFVSILGGLLALIANAFSPRGLSLTRDYYPLNVPPSKSVATNTEFQVTGAQPAITRATNTAGTNAVLATSSVLARLRAHGLQPIEHDEVVTTFNDPRTAQDHLVFVDARNDKEYQAGHIPGAVQLDFYRLEPYLPTALAACQTADKVIVYCNGGDCDDSEKTADMLSKFVPKEKLFVYPGGFEQWSATGQPVEMGARRSGVLKEAKR